ncbi:MAG: excinuclease ABC subunit UvrC [Clostridia bacterium]|nr:excinuclease ABC subunit UvrC [Clostridia bacterium]
MGNRNAKFDARLDLVPYNPGVYLMKDASGLVIYVGKAKKLRNRLSSYFASGTITNPKVKAMVSHVADFEYVVVGSESEALLLEANLIKRYMPQYNILLRDDRGYPYICISLNEQYPRVFKAYRVDEKLKKAGALYFGPYMSGDEFKMLKTIDEIFPLKKCNKVLPRDIGKERPCLNSHIGKCMAPCSGMVSSDEYKEMINEIVKLFEGKYEEIEKKLIEKMQAYAENNEFELAAGVRDRLFALRATKEKQSVFLDVERDADAIGFYAEAGEACIRKLELRQGRLVGSSTYFVKGGNEDRNEILTNFIMQYYPESPFVPQLILVTGSDEFEDKSTIEEALSSAKGRKVEIKTPERGELNRLLKMADLNSREMMVRRVLRGGNASSDPMEPVHMLEKIMGLKVNSVNRIEAFDISNLGNDDICAGMVVFNGGKPDKKEYRLFKMKTVITQDDFASMREVLLRRFGHDEKDGFKFPDLILADGGKGQMTSIRESLNELNINIPLAGMVKNNHHKTESLLLEDGTLIELNTDENIPLLRFLTAVQNEVHRYAITYQRKLSHKRNIHYTLEDISGIGPAKRKRLLAHFDTIKAIANADKKALAEVSGLSASDCDNIYEYFHGSEE